MAHPVPVVKTPIELSAEDVAQVDSFVEVFVRLTAAGTVGAEVLSPVIAQFGVNPPAPLELVTAKQQLFYRQLGIALRKAGVISVGTGGGGTTTSQTISQPFNAAVEIHFGAGVYVTTTGGIADGDCRDDDKSRIVGIATASAAPGVEVRIVSVGTIAGVLDVATPGTPFFLGQNGQPVLFDSLQFGERIIQLGIARSSTDLEVRLFDLGVR